MTEAAWKPNWAETKQHFLDWWNRDGMIIGAWGPVRSDTVLHEEAPDTGSWDIQKYYRDPEYHVTAEHYKMSQSIYPLDVLPCAYYDTGPGSLALYLGSEAGISEETVWFEPCMDPDDPESFPPLEFDPHCEWWKITEKTFRLGAEKAQGKYILGCSDLIENIDVLSSLRGAEPMLMDLVLRPEWCDEKLQEINAAWIEAYDRIYDIIKLEDGSSAWNAFSIWGKGKTAKLQSDACAMISPDMFERFVLPYLTEQADYTDNSLYHLDGHQCIVHLDHLLSIENLDCIEWTPDPQVPKGGDPQWYPMYRKILEAGKCVQAIGIKHNEIVPLLDAVGPKGMYIMTEIHDEADAEKISRLIEPYR